MHCNFGKILFIIADPAISLTWVDGLEGSEKKDCISKHLLHSAMDTQRTRARAVAGKSLQILMLLWELPITIAVQNDRR